MIKYVWSVGELALAKTSCDRYSNARVIKDENGFFYGTKVLGTSRNEDGTIIFVTEMCYYVELTQTKFTIWLPYTNLHLAERPRPFYGIEKPVPTVKNLVPKKRQLKERTPYTEVPLKYVKLSKPETKIEIAQLPIRKSKCENLYKEYIRRGKDVLFDEYYNLLRDDASRTEDWHYVNHIDASTENKFETVIKENLTEKEIVSYLKSCWRYNYLNEVYANIPDLPKSPQKSDSIIRTYWCIVCGGKEDLYPCKDCPAMFHYECVQEWPIAISHRKAPLKEMFTQQVEITNKKTRSRANGKQNNVDVPNFCPSCAYGPNLGYGDLVWHKLGPCAWWPAQVLNPGEIPQCLMSRKHTPEQYPVRYFGTLNHSWGDVGRMCLFLPSHAQLLSEPRSMEHWHDAILDACDHYIVLYLT